ncbi:MAG TPA: response regulator [Opitutaceae bacterium]|jgi:two-component system KDP operon response regulator KdpE|nr:response regulator [Opitutaceae bacterium]
MSPAKLRILVVDDEVQIRRLLRITLEAAGIAVLEADTGKIGLEEAARCNPDAVILDLGLPDLGGLEVLRQLREWTKVPVLVLTVLAAEGDKVAALDAGADDYLTKPFGSAELTARLRAILRRVVDESEPSSITFGDIEINLAARTVKRLGADVRLTAKEYAMLRLLVIHRGKVVTHGQMLRELWGPKAEENTHYLRVHMTHIRQKLEAEPHKPRHLKTESGIGYRLVED